ncbi:hypothetical protein KIN20_026532 [Parelaphostrongylus tenuis]|uniref:Uncharacterized protein n=1 Tax=Parelaphostrongylus tenuis TaxID=148309 RepID=A0AAD5WCY7_PARTN|nr:hypothetical protein KIN20_026532 [Parelaphostrongylus tenuis]
MDIKLKDFDKSRSTSYQAQQLAKEYCQSLRESSSHLVMALYRSPVAIVDVRQTTIHNVV